MSKPSPLHSAIGVMALWLFSVGADHYVLYADDPSRSEQSTRETASESVTAIVGALNIELKPLEEQLNDTTMRTIEKMRFVEGRLKGKKVVLTQCCAGKVNAAMVTTLLLEHFRPNRVLMTGTAGGINPELRSGDIIIGAKTTYHDFGDLIADGLRANPTRNPLTKTRNPLYFPADEKLLALAQQAIPTVASKLDASGRMSKIKTGTIVTGDSFVLSSAARSRLREKHDADATEMEGAAVAQICWQQNIPCLVIRSLSDNADEEAKGDFDQFAKTASQNAAMLIAAIVEQL